MKALLVSIWSKYYWVVCLLVFSWIVYAQTEPAPPVKPNTLTAVVQTRPIAIPTGLTTLMAQNAYVCYADVTGTGQNVLIEDMQPTPVPWLNNVIGSSGSPTTFIFTAPNDAACRFFPAGIQWQANSTGATAYLTIKCFATPCVLKSGF